MGRIFMLLVIVILAGGGWFLWKNPHKIPPGVLEIHEKLQAFIPKNIPGLSKLKGTTGPSPSSAPMNQNQPTSSTLPSAANILQKMTGTLALSNPLFSDLPLVLVKTPPSGEFVLVAYSTQGPMFYSYSFKAQGSLMSTPPIPLSGPTNLHLFQRSPNGTWAKVSETGFTLHPSQKPTLTPLPSRMEILNRWVKDFDAFLNLMNKSRPKVALWQKNQLEYWKNIQSMEEIPRDCLRVIQHPKACTHLAQLWRDIHDSFQTASLIHAKTPVSKIDKAVGRSDKQIYQSSRIQLKALHDLVEAPKAIESVEPKDLELWVRSAFR